MTRWGSEREKERLLTATIVCLIDLACALYRRARFFIYYESLICRLAESNREMIHEY